MQTYEWKLRDEHERLLDLEEYALDLMRIMQEDSGVENIDPELRREICRALKHLARFHRKLKFALASSSEMLLLLGVGEFSDSGRGEQDQSDPDSP